MFDIVAYFDGMFFISDNADEILKIIVCDSDIVTMQTLVHVTHDSLDLTFNPIATIHLCITTI